MSSISGEIKALGDSIVRTHDGQMWFTFAEISKITNISTDHIGRRLDEAGVTVKKHGPKKLAHAYGIAGMMLQNRISPLDGRQ